MPRSVRRWTFEVRRPTLAPRGFTLVELLVVILIIVSVTALAIGVSVPDVQTRRIREAARQINAHIQGAKARAAEIGRPVAVVIQPDPGNPFAAFTLKYAEVPPAYSGDLVTSVAFITGPPPGERTQPLQQPAQPNQQATVVPKTDPLASQDDFAWQGLLRAGDFIQFNDQGPYYRIVNPANAQGFISSTPWIIEPLELGGTITNPAGPNPYTGSGAVPLRYRVIRQPVASAGFDLELPESVVVDLSVSGPESGVFVPPAATPPPPQPVTILFSPGGSVLSCWVGTTFCPASRPLYLMVGNIEGVDAPYANLQDLRTIWVTINHQTGLVTSVENQGGADLTQLNRAREFARKAQTLGGRS